MHNWVAHSHHHVDVVMGSDVDLLDLCLPERVVVEDASQFHQMNFGKAVVDIPRHHGHVGFVATSFHSNALVVQIVVVAVLGEDA